MQSTKQDGKTIMARLHAYLYDYLRLFKHVRPTTKEFDAIFKPDMFMKNNKAAFHHVIHHMLTILNPAVIKKKITNWPILDTKMEAQFRREVMSYINELGTLYPDFEIPTIVTSQLINPGGVKFLTLMCDIAHLVSCQVLDRAGYEQPLVPSLEPHKKVPTKVICEHIAKSTAVVHSRIRRKLEAHKMKQKEREVEAERLDSEILKTKKNIIHLQKKLAEEQLDFVDTNVEEEMDKLEVEMLDILEMQQKFNHCVSRLNYLASDECYLSMKAPSVVEHLEAFHKRLSVTKIFDIKRVDRSVVESQGKALGLVLNEYDRLSLEELPRLASRQESFLSKLIRESEEATASNTMLDSQRTLAEGE